MEFKAKGNKLYSQGKVQQSVEAYTKGIDLVEEQGEGTTEEDMGCVHLLYSNRSMAHLDLFMVDESLQDAELAIEAKPEYGKAYARRAAVMVDLWNFKEALQDMDKAEELDPSLAGSLSELRLRATGKKWVPNCYLRKQVELQKKHKCDYVLMLEFEGEDIVEPIVFPPARSGADASARALKSLIKTGSAGNIVAVIGGDSGVDMSVNCYLTLAEFNSKIKARVNDTTTYIKMIAEQLVREFGPKDGFSVSGIAPYVFHKPENRKDYYLALAMEYVAKLEYLSMTPNQKDPHHVELNILHLFPGSPKWMQGALHPSFLREIQTQFKELENFSEFDLNNVIRTVEVVRGRYFQKDREKKCHGCSIAITDPDPQECICGHFYCSYFCHTDDRKHVKECQAIMLALNAVNVHNLYAMFTALYWQRVYDGVFPCKSEPHAVTLWKERKMPEDNSEISRQNEFKFYVEIETSSLLEDVNQYTFAARNPSKLPDPRMQHQLFVETMDRWFHAAGTPLDTDSLTRLQSKAAMAMTVDQFWKKRTGGMEKTPGNAELTAKEQAEQTPLNEAMWNLLTHLEKRVIAKELGADQYLVWVKSKYKDHCAVWGSPPWATSALASAPPTPAGPGCTADEIEEAEHYMNNVTREQMTHAIQQRMQQLHTKMNLPQRQEMLHKAVMHESRKTGLSPQEIQARINNQ